MAWGWYNNNKITDFLEYDGEAVIVFHENDCADEKECGYYRPARYVTWKDKRYCVAAGNCLAWTLGIGRIGGYGPVKTVAEIFAYYICREGVVTEDEIFKLISSRYRFDPDNDREINRILAANIFAYGNKPYYLLRDVLPRLPPYDPRERWCRMCKKRFPAWQLTGRYITGESQSLYQWPEKIMVCKTFDCETKIGKLESEACSWYLKQQRKLKLAKRALRELNEFRLGRSSPETLRKLASRLPTSSRH